MQTIRAQECVNALLYIADVIDTNKDYLTELDSAIGDGDLGVSMTLGFGAIRDELAEFGGGNLQAILRQCGMAFSNHAPSTIGALYATGFLQAASSIGKKDEIAADDVRAMIEAAIAGIRKRGKVELGEKTMIDALVPAFEAFQEESEHISDLCELMDVCASAAEVGMKETEQMKSTRGRSRWLQERTIGHIDPGAATVAIVLRACSDWCRMLDKE
jgi:dihydroxyacetone kinase-like protein